MSAPYEVVCSPFQVWAAPVGTTFPKIDDANGSINAAFTLVGTSGSLSMDEGVTVNHPQSVQEWTPAGGTAPRKVWRQSEGLTVSFSIADVSAAQYAMLLDSATITTVAASPTTAGEQSFEIERGVNVDLYAVLVRGISPVNESLIAQYEIPAAYQGASPSPKFAKEGPAILAVEFHAVEIVSGKLATLRIGSAAKT